MKQKYIALLKYILCIISGIMLAIAFTYPKLWFLCMFGISPLFFVILKYDFGFRKMIKCIFAFSLGYYVPLLLWILNINVLLPFSETTSKIILFIGTILIALLQGIYISLATIFFCKVKRNNYSDVFVFSLLFCFGEWLIEYTPILAFPWGKIGVIATPYTPFIQSASIFGGMFISFLILIINGTIAFIVINFKNKKKAISAIIISSVIFITNVIFGTIRIKSEVKRKQFKALIVQGNFSGLSKWQTSSDEMFKTYVKLSKDGADNETKIIVWPETAIPITYSEDCYYERQLKSLSKELDAVIVTGLFISKDKNDKCYNALMAVSPDGTISNTYCKQILAPFGEYFPLGNFFQKIAPKLEDTIKNSSGILFGDKTEIIKTPVAKIGGIICYESTFTKLSVENVREGSDILAVASNDSWFGESSALYQHFSHARIRAVESSRFVLRSSNTGITAIISPYGEVINMAKPSTQSYASAYVYLSNNINFYCKNNTIFVMICFVSYFYCILLSYYKHKRNNCY